jgi:hypothetical protein
MDISNVTYKARSDESLPLEKTYSEKEVKASSKNPQNAYMLAMETIRDIIQTLGLSAKYSRDEIDNLAELAINKCIEQGVLTSQKGKLSLVFGAIGCVSILPSVFIGDDALKKSIQLLAQQGIPSIGELFKSSKEGKLTSLQGYTRAVQSRQSQATDKLKEIVSQKQELDRIIDMLVQAVKKTLERA